MNIFSNFIPSLFKEIADFYNSGTFSVIKFILGIYTAVLVIDIILLLFQRGLSIDFRENFLGVNVPRELVRGKNKLKLTWEKILKRLDSSNESEYKVAIIEADKLVDELIAKFGYKGENFKERLDAIPEGHLKNLEKIKEAHEVRNKVIHEENFALNREEARRILDNFSELLKFFEVID